MMPKNRNVFEGSLSTRPFSLTVSGEKGLGDRLSLIRGALGWPLLLLRALRLKGGDVVEGWCLFVFAFFPGHVLRVGGCYVLLPEVNDCAHNNNKGSLYRGACSLCMTVFPKDAVCK